MAQPCMSQGLWISCGGKSQDTSVHLVEVVGRVVAGGEVGGVAKEAEAWAVVVVVVVVVAAAAVVDEAGTATVEKVDAVAAAAMATVMVVRVVVAGDREAAVCIPGMRRTKGFHIRTSGRPQLAVAHKADCRRLLVSSRPADRLTTDGRSRPSQSAGGRSLHRRADSGRPRPHRTYELRSLDV